MASRVLSASEIAAALIMEASAYGEAIADGEPRIERKRDSGRTKKEGDEMKKG